MVLQIHVIFWSTRPTANGLPNITEKTYKYTNTIFIGSWKEEINTI